MNRPTNEKIIETYLDFNESKSTRKTCLNYFFQVKYFGYDGHVFDIDTKVLLDYFKYLKDLDLSIHTKETKWYILKGFLDFCMEYYNEYNFYVVFPKKIINWNSGNHRKPNGDKEIVMTKEEIAKILNYLKIYNFRYYLIFRILAETGMRKGELINLNIDGVDLENRTLYTAGKTGDQTYFISKDLANYLNVYLEQRKSIITPTKALFLSKGLYRYGSRAFNLYLKKILKLEDIDKNITCHTFRKTVNTLRFNMGGRDSDLEFLLGHKVSVNRDHYIKLIQDQKLEIFDKLNPYKDVNI